MAETPAGVRVVGESHTDLARALAERRPRRTREQWPSAAPADDPPPSMQWMEAGRVWYAAGDGEERAWECVRRTPRPGTTADAAAVDIIAVLGAAGGGVSRLVLVFNYRPPVDNWVLELPAGMVDAGAHTRGHLRSRRARKPPSRRSGD